MNRRQFLKAAAGALAGMAAAAVVGVQSVPASADLGEVRGAIHVYIEHDVMRAVLMWEDGEEVELHPPMRIGAMPALPDGWNEVEL